MDDSSRDDRSRLQGIVYELRDQGGGILHLQEGVWYFSEPLVLPRSLSDGSGAVHIIGDSMMQTEIRGMDSFPTGRALIEWEPAESGAARVYNQHVADLTLRPANVDGCKAIHYEVTSAEGEADPTVERWTGEIENVRVQGFNTWHESLIRIEGNVHSSRFANILGDPGLGDQTHDTVLLHFDEGEDAGLDVGGAYWSTFERITTTPIRGGWCAMFHGRLVASRFHSCLIGKGTQTDPAFKITNGAGFTLENMASEGSAADQFVFESCRSSTLKNSTIGYPSAAPHGDSVKLIDCKGVRVEGIPLWSNVPALNTGKRVSLDEDCDSCVVDVDLCSTNTLANAISDEGTNNRIRVRNATSGAIETNEAWP